MSGYYMDSDGFVGRWATPLSDVHFGDRPVVVIDPEDAEQVDHICKALVEAMHLAGDTASAARGIHPATMRASLRSLITPPKSPEPTGLGAVVEDADGVRWVRVVHTAYPWTNGKGEWFQYDELNAVKVLSEGVTP